jgi:predicted small metal-binding protein
VDDGDAWIILAGLTATKEELLKHVELHAKEVHPEADVKREDVEQVIKTAS